MCEISYPERRMYDIFICTFCKEESTTEEIVRKFQNKTTDFTRYIPQKLKDLIFYESGGVCQYCYENEATQIDHILPFSFLPNHSHSNLIASCRRCNLAANNKMFFTIEEKRRYIVSKVFSGITKKTIVIWTQDDLREVSYELRGGKKAIVKDLREAYKLAQKLKEAGVPRVVVDGSEWLSHGKFYKFNKRDK